MVSLEGGVRITCDACAVDISHTTRIACAECEEDCDVCIPCFRSGAEFADHKPWHDYRIVETHSVPIFEVGWGADEELMLITGLQTHGLGNWQEVAEHIGTRTKEECERHYERIYLAEGGPREFLPTPKRFAISRDEFQARKKRRLEELRKPVALSAAMLEQQRASAPTSGEIAGWMPGRLEFEHEPDNEAETIIKDMSFGIVDAFGGDEQPEEPPVRPGPPPEPKPKDNEEGSEPEEEQEAARPPPEPEDPEELELKLAMLDIYFETLRRRAEIKDFIFDRGLMDHKRIVAAEKKRAKEERDLVQRYKPFARLQTAEDFELLIDGLTYEQSLRKRIAELQEYRKMGITSAADAIRYEKVKAERANGFRGPSAPIPREPMTATERNLKRVNTPRFGVPAVPETKALAATARPAAPLTKFENSDNLSLLTAAEIKLCCTLNILPRPYLIIKETLLRENSRRGGLLSKRDAKKILNLDEYRVEKIYDLLRSLGILFRQSRRRQSAAEQGEVEAAS